MKRYLCGAGGLLLVLRAGVALAADLEFGDFTNSAAPRATAPSHVSRVRPPTYGGNFGIGLEAGSEQGVAAKLRLGRMTAVDAGLGWDGTLRFHSDFIYEGGPFLSRRKLGMAWFAGAGARAEQDQSTQGNLYGYGLAMSSAAKPGGGPKGPPPPPSAPATTSTQLGVAARVPVGVELRFTGLPRLETFGEAALEVGVIGRPGAALGGQLGARWYF